MGKRDRELLALLCLSAWCLVIVVWLFLAVPWVCLQFVIVVNPDHTHLLFPIYKRSYMRISSRTIHLSVVIFLNMVTLHAAADEIL